MILFLHKDILFTSIKKPMVSFIGFFVLQLYGKNEKGVTSYNQNLAKEKTHWVFWVCLGLFGLLK